MENILNNFGGQAKRDTWQENWKRITGRLSKRGHILINTLLS